MTMANRYCSTALTRRLAIIIAALLLSMPHTGCVKEDAPEHDGTTVVAIGDTAPDFEVSLIDGTTTTLTSLRGKVVMLIFFSTGCPDCKAQFDRMRQLIAQQHPSFHILAISRDESAEQTNSFISSYDMNIAVGIDPGRAIYEKYATMYVPRNFLIGRDGRIEALTIEYQESELLSIWDKAESMAK